MKQQVFFIHGGMSFSKYDNFLQYLCTTEVRNLPGEESTKRWTHTLAEDLESCEVFTPRMPNSQNSKYKEWKIWFERHFEYLRNDLILIGWSQGGMFLIKYLTENQPPFKVRHLFLLAAPYDFFQTEGEDGGDFYAIEEKIPSLGSKAQNITIMHSKDDFVVPYTHGERLAASLPKAEFITFEDKNHFLIEEFPELLEKVREVAGK